MRPSIKHAIAIVTFIFNIWGTSHAQTTMTLEECRKQAIDFNKELKKARLQNKEAKMNQEVARTSYLPSLSGSLSLMHLPGNISVNSSGYFLPTANSEAEALAGKYSGTSNVWNPGIKLEQDNLTLLNSGLSLTQPIYAGGKIKYSNKQADAGVAIAKNALNLKYSEIIENTDQAFWQLAMMNENIKIAEEYIKMLTELEDQMTSMYKVGLQPASEKLKVTVQKNKAELDLIKAKNGFKIARMYLNQIMGLPFDKQLEIKYEPIDQVQLINMSDGSRLAAQNRSELKIMEKQKEISEYDAKITRADYLPTVGVSAQYSSLWVKDLYEKNDFKTMLSANVSIPIFHWGQGAKKQRAARLKIEQAQTELENTKDLINLEVMKVKVQVEEAYQSVLLAQKSVAEAEESMSETRASFDVGLNTTSDLLNAQAQWQEAKALLTNAIAQYRVVQTSWQRVTGKLQIQE